MLQARGIEFDQVNYYIDPLPEAKIRSLLHKAGLVPRDLLRPRDALYRELDLANSSHSDDEIIALMVKNPDLIQRPIGELGDRAVLGRPPERILELLD